MWWSSQAGQSDVALRTRRDGMGLGWSIACANGDGAARSACTHVPPRVPIHGYTFEAVPVDGYITRPPSTHRLLARALLLLRRRRRVRHLLLQRGQLVVDRRRARRLGARR